MTDKPKQARYSACFLSVKTEITCACSDIHPFKKPETSGFPAQLVDISKPGLNSKIKKFSYSFICGKGYSPPSGGRIAFCLQSEAGCACLHLRQSPPRIKVLLTRAILRNFPYVKKSPLRTRTPQRRFFYYPSVSTAHTVSTPSLTVNRTFFPANATPYTRSGSLW